ncbi:MAG: peptidylprolyl isomerase [Bacteroidota bacterium]
MLKFEKRLKLFLFLIAIATVFCVTNTAKTQVKEGETLEKIIAVVGDEFITLSDLNAQVFLMKQSNPSINTEDPDLRKKILDALINEKLIITRAIEDSITVSDEEVEQRWEFQLQQYLQYYGSEKRLEDIFGMSINQIKYESGEIIKKKLLAEKVQQKKLMNVKTSPTEVDDFYKLYKDSIETIPAQIELFHIVRFVSASPRAKEEIYNLARRVRDSLIAGGDFAEFAKRYSQDPGSAASGGDLGWFQKGKLIREFEKAAFDLLPGQISQPVETPFGYHLILLVDKRKDSLLTKHILFKIGESNEEADATKKFLLALRDSVLAGKNFEVLAKKYSEEKETQGFGGFIGKVPLAKIPANWQDIVTKLKVGEVSEPQIYTTDKNKPAFNILYKKSYIPEHKPTLEGDRKEIEEMALNYKRMQIMQEWVAELRTKMYWEIKNQ